MRSIRSRLIVTTLSLAVLLVITMTIVSGVQVTNSIYNSLLGTMEPLSEQAAESLKFHINNLTKTSEQLAAELSSSTDYSADIRACLAEYMDDYLLGIAVFDANGNALAAAGSIDTASAAETELINSVSVSGNSAISGTVMTADGNMRFFVFSKIRNDTDNCVCLQYDFTKINEVVAAIEVSENSRAYVTASTGLVIFDKNIINVSSGYNPVALARTNDDYEEISDMIKTANASQVGSRRYEFNGDNWISGYAEIKGTSWSLIVTAPSDDFSDQVSSGVMMCILVGVVALAIVVIVIVFFARTISEPIVRTTKRLRALSQGNLSDPVDVCYTKDELGILSNSLEETVVSLRQYINQITAMLTNISEGNLKQRIEGNFKGDFVKIKSTFNNILVSLSDTFASINNAAEQVNSGAMQVANGSQSLSQGSTQQASSIEELSATVQDVSNQIALNAQAAKTANSIVEQNAKKIHSCNTEMEHMLEAMDRIRVSSDEISKIIKVIDEIAFQTNILALNAAVEAARAGAAGKSFTVVADEVRRLATKTAEAAEQTAVLIEDSVATVKQGTKIAEETASSLSEMVEGYATIETLVGEISDAYEHQADAIVQINTGVEQISAVVQVNTATALEYASASEELSSQSLILRNMINRFKLRDNNSEGSDNSEYDDFDEMTSFDYQNSDLSFSEYSDAELTDYKTSETTDADDRAEFLAEDDKY